MEFCTHCLYPVMFRLQQTSRVTRNSQSSHSALSPDLFFDRMGISTPKNKIKIKPASTPKCRAWQQREVSCCWLLQPAVTKRSSPFRCGLARRLRCPTGQRHFAAFVHAEHRPVRIERLHQGHSLWLFGLAALSLMCRFNLKANQLIHWVKTIFKGPLRMLWFVGLELPKTLPIIIFSSLLLGESMPSVF